MIGRLPDEEPCSFEALEAFSACDSDSDCERGSCIPSLDCIKRKPRDNDEEEGAEDGEARFRFEEVSAAIEYAAATPDGAASPIFRLRPDR